MIRAFIYIPLIFLVAACSSNKKMVSNEYKGMPSCLLTKIKGSLNDPNQNAPQSVTQYTYKGQTVFYVTAPCCDQYNSVYDYNCNYLGAPDGGITGKGDGRLKDFHTEAKDEKIVWENGK